MWFRSVKYDYNLYTVLKKIVLRFKLKHFLNQLILNLFKLSAETVEFSIGEKIFEILIKTKQLTQSEFQFKIQSPLLQ